MLKVKKIAVTGSLSAGKTTVCQLFKALGAYVVSADEIVHRLLSPGTPLSDRVVTLLGPSVLTGTAGERQLNRRKIADIVFSNPEQLMALEALLHPAVFKEIDETYEKINQSKQHPLFVAEIPLLYETKQEDRFDTVIAVVSEESLCKDRFQHKKTTTPQEFTMRMNRQLPPQFKAEQADYTLYNNGSLDLLEAQVKALYSQLIQASLPKKG